jgi:hypothetical protein
MINTRNWKGRSRAIQALRLKKSAQIAEGQNLDAVIDMLSDWGV